MAQDNQWTPAGPSEPIQASDWQVAGPAEPLAPTENKPSIRERIWGALNYPLGKLLPGYQREAQELREGANASAVRAGELQNNERRTNTFFPSMSDLYLLKGTAQATEADLADALFTPVGVATAALGAASQAPGAIGRVAAPAMRVAGAGFAAQGATDLYQTRHEGWGVVPDLQRAQDLFNIATAGAGEVAAGRARNAMRDIQAGRYGTPTPEAAPEEAPQAQTPPERRDVAKRNALQEAVQKSPALKWYTNMKMLDEAKASDAAYKDVVPELAATPLAEGETWRGRVLNAVQQESQRTVQSMMEPQKPVAPPPEEAYPEPLKPLGEPEPLNEAEKAHVIQQQTAKQIPGFGEKPADEQQALVAEDLKRNQEQAQQLQTFAAQNPKVLDAAEQIRNNVGKLQRMQQMLAAGEPDLSTEAIKAATGRSFRDLAERHFTQQEQDEYADLRGHIDRRRPQANTPSEDAALRAASEDNTPDRSQLVRAFIEDADLQGEVNKELFKRFQASQPAGTKGLDRVALRQFAQENQLNVMSDIAELHGFSERPVDVQSPEQRKLSGQEVASGTLEGGVAASASEAGMTSPADRARIRAMRTMAVQREAKLTQQALKKSFLPQFQQALSEGGQSPFTPSELNNFPNDTRNAILRILRAAKPAVAPTPEEGRGTVVPKPATEAAAPETPAAQPAAGPQEGVEVAPLTTDEELKNATDEQLVAQYKAHVGTDLAGLANRELGVRHTQEEKDALLGFKPTGGGLQPGVAPPAPQAQTPPSVPPPPTAPPPTAAEAPPPPPSKAPTVTLQDLTAQLEQYPKLPKTISERLLKPLQNVGAEYKGLKGKASEAYNTVKWAAANAWNSYRHPLDWTDFDAAIGRYSGNNQVLAKALHDFVKVIVPRTDSLTREGMANYLDVGGDQQKLQNAFNATTDPKLKAGYEKALNLTPTQQEQLDKIHAFMESERDEAMKAGVLNAARADYIMHIWQRPNVYTDRLMSNINFGELQVNPSFNRQRVFDTYFDGERAGFVPAKKDVGFLIAAHHASFGRAVAARGFIREMMGGNARDGRPYVAISGAGIPVTDPVDGSTSYLVKPNALRAVSPTNVKNQAQLQALVDSGKLYLNNEGKPKIDVGDYKTIDHPALRAWKWVAPSEDGNVMLQGDLRVHPEVYGKLNNILSRSAIASSKLGRALLSTSSVAKHTLLTLSFFHQVQEGVHAMGHGVNPFGPAKLDLEQPLQRALVDHGLMVADFGAQSQFSEGVSDAGLLRYVPYLGEWMHTYQDYLFRDYIPRLKMDMAQQAFRRNTERYAGKMSREQILALTARQANAAFGGLNYKLMGRNPTFQDMLRLTMLAPDFMESRVRFAAQAALPTGQEQLNALLKIALTQYVGARILNYAVNKDAHWDPQDAFSLIVGNSRYQIRSVPGDMLRAIDDERKFVQHRANPLTVRPLIEMYTGRDEFGRQRTPGQVALDYARNMAPIPFQGPIKKGDQDLANSIWTSLGVESSKYYTPAENLALAYLRNHESTGPEDTAEMEKQRNLTQLREGIQQGKVGWDSVWKLADDGKLTSAQIDHLVRSVDQTNLQRWTQGLKLSEAIDVYKHAKPEEQKQLHDALYNKILKEDWEHAPQLISQLKLE